MLQLCSLGPTPALDNGVRLKLFVFTRSVSLKFDSNPLTAKSANTSTCFYSSEFSPGLTHRAEDKL